MKTKIVSKNYVYVSIHISVFHNSRILCHVHCRGCIQAWCDYLVLSVLHDLRRSSVLDWKWAFLSAAEICFLMACMHVESCHPINVMFTNIHLSEVNNTISVLHPARDFHEICRKSSLLLCLPLFHVCLEWANVVRGSRQTDTHTHSLAHPDYMIT